jgi:hypothetical protein
MMARSNTLQSEAGYIDARPHQPEFESSHPSHAVGLFGVSVAAKESAWHTRQYQSSGHPAAKRVVADVVVRNVSARVIDR